MKDNGKIIKEMEEVLKFGKMDPFMKGIGKIILHMGLEDLFTLMEMYILVNGKMIELMVKV
jgi:hypothetical protein